MRTADMEKLVNRVVIEKKTGTEYMIEKICDCWHGIGKTGKKGRIARCINIENNEIKYLEANEIE